MDVTLYLRIVKNTVETMDRTNVQWTFGPACGRAQIIKASTSSGANYEESQGSPTKPDVKTKIGISLKECVNRIISCEYIAG